MSNIIENTNFEKENYSQIALAKGEYDNCTFLNCVFSDSDLSNVSFTECKFQDCDLSNVNLKHTVLNDVHFLNCKLLGLQFNDCSDFLFSVSFNKCNLNLATFYQVKAKGTKFDTCILQKVDFTEADVTNSLFNNCDFKSAIFERTIVEKSDFRTSYNYAMDPENNKIKKAKFSMPEVLGLLSKYNIEVK
ncbi:MAG: hypothetical protein COA88_01490 [Kordia sp.]|nr:MAG: hypothetical protein COA88_01490 [Kordia sp.]